MRAGFGLPDGTGTLPEEMIDGAESEEAGADENTCREACYGGPQAAQGEDGQRQQYEAEAWICLKKAVIGFVVRMDGVAGESENFGLFLLGREAHGNACRAFGQPTSEALRLKLPLRLLRSDLIGGQFHDGA